MHDPRVNRREAEQIVIALRDRGFPVEYLLADDEGHGFARPVNSLAMFMAAEKERSARVFQQARFMKTIATILAIIFAIFILGAAIYILKKNPTLLHPGR